jgi:hypothetical protein
MRTRPVHVVVGLALVVAAVGGLAGCGGDDDTEDDANADDTVDGIELSDEAQITYHYGDSSVPPEFHRSYTLTIGATEVHAVVDSYGDVLGDVTVDLPAEVWDGLVADAGSVAALDADERDGEGEGCAGGTSRDLEIVDGGATVVARSFPVCGGANEAPAQALDAYVQPVLDAIPDWSALVAT